MTGMKNMVSSRFIAGGVIGAVIGMYAISQMTPKDRKRIMKRGRKILSSATNVIDGISIF